MSHPCIIPWNEKAAHKHDRGFMLPLVNETCGATQLRMHVSVINAGEAPHPPHQHAGEEIVFLLEGTVEVLIGEERNIAAAILAVPFVVALFTHSASPQEKPGSNRHFPVTDPKNFTRVVAKVGNIEITAQEFLLSYEFGPAFTKRRKESRQRYLEFMVNEKLLALDARAHGLQNSSRVTRSLEELEGDMATEELFKDDVLGKVTLAKSEIERGMREGAVHYKLQWLYAPGSGEANSLQSELNRGTPFDSLFARELRTGVKRDDRSMESTLFKLRRANPLLASVAETLRAGRSSEPVRGTDGYYIIRIADGWRDVTLSATESQKSQEGVRRALTQEKSDSLSDRYVRKMMLEHDPVIIRTTFDRLHAWLGGIWVLPLYWILRGLLPPSALATGAVLTSPVGTYPITVDVSGMSARNYTFSAVNGTLIVTKAASQTITFGPLSDKTYGNPTFTVSATASSLLPVTMFTSTGDCSVSGSTVTITGADSVTDVLGGAQLWAVPAAGAGTP